MHEAESFKFLSFDPNVFLSDQIISPQIEYIRGYLVDLDASDVLEEPNYFDRDYLSEFSSFYGQSVEGYKNICRRLHVFKKCELKDIFKRAVSGDEKALHTLQEHYLGFIVIRPIKTAPLGKTVLKWYPEKTIDVSLPNFQDPRVTEPSREYKADICGIVLSVKGLAWQQQDRGVAACATIALWSMLQSSALDEYHFIPTTSEITEAAKKDISYGQRIYPAFKGLTMEQICGAIKGVGLSPCVIYGDNQQSPFDKMFFKNICSAFIRSGYPVLLAGSLSLPNQPSAGYHAICAVGFRQNLPQLPNKGTVNSYDGSIHHLYIHDDNVGPNVRFKICSDEDFVVLQPDCPDYKNTHKSVPNYSFTPNTILAAVNTELRADPVELHRQGREIAFLLNSILKSIPFPNGLTLSSRFIKKTEYIGSELSRLLGGTPHFLLKTRLALTNEVKPMSKYIGLVRIGVGSNPILDVLFDTSDSFLRTFATVSYMPHMEEIINWQHRFDFGKYIAAHK